MKRCALFSFVCILAATIDAGDVNLLRLVPQVKPDREDLENGLDPVERHLAQGGVGGARVEHPLDNRAQPVHLDSRRAWLDLVQTRVQPVDVTMQRGIHAKHRTQAARLLTRPIAQRPRPEAQTQGVKDHLRLGAGELDPDHALRAEADRRARS